MLDFAQHLVTNTDLSVLHPSAIDFVGNLHFNIVDLHSHVHMDLIAQQPKQDLMSDVGKSWENFVKTGQIWAMIIGVAVGYLFRSISMG